MMMTTMMRNESAGNHKITHFYFPRVIYSLFNLNDSFRGVHDTFCLLLVSIRLLVIVFLLPSTKS